ncbi:hypothetical protein MUK42_00205 [Musa troglodytarum]|uniref:Uncharacterized protein n=1 Tax=Musa troglodytarum TaxID=320322 RepID=A0A9E7JSH1_9LILI|nr:hypothetical protein MUK42_00205 [Musa troglodytarum]
MGETVPTAPPVVVVAPSPKSPPKYPDLCGRRRLQLELQILNREVGFIEWNDCEMMAILLILLMAVLENNIKMDYLVIFSCNLKRSCNRLKEFNLFPDAAKTASGDLGPRWAPSFVPMWQLDLLVNDFVGTKPDPLIPINKRRHKSCCLWRWIRYFLNFVSCNRYYSTKFLPSSELLVSYPYEVLSPGQSCVSISHGFAASVSVALVREAAPVINVNAPALNAVRLLPADPVTENAAAAPRLLAVVEEHASAAQKFHALAAEHAAAARRFLAVAGEHAAAAQKFLALAGEHAAAAQKFLALAGEHAAAAQKFLAVAVEDAAAAQKFLALVAEHAAAAPILAVVLEHAGAAQKILAVAAKPAAVAQMYLAANRNAIA